MGLMSPIFYHKAESWAFGAGFRYESANLDFSDKAVFDEDNLHSIDLPFQQNSIRYARLDTPLQSDRGGDFSA